jgi:hypothetical protein
MSVARTSGISIEVLLPASTPLMLTSLGRLAPSGVCRFD